MLSPTTITGLLLLAAQRCTAEDANTARDDTSGFHNREILLGLYTATGGLDWTDSSNWFQQGTDVCDWNGVNCYGEEIADERKQGQIQEIRLTNNHLVGTVPTQIFDIPYLERVIIEDNPDADIDLSGLSKAQFLNHLSVSNTQVSNIDSIADAKNLEVLHITGLGLKGTIPSAIWELSNLVALFANDNSFSGTLSSKIGKLKKLDEIYLNDSELTGQIPSELGLLTGLETLSLGQNAFGGTLPTEINLLTNLVMASIQREAGREKGTGIGGQVPAFDNHKKLTKLNLENQRFSGELDENFLLHCPSGESVVVDLSSNMLEGSVKGNLVDKKYLTLFLADNQIESVSEQIISTVNNNCPDIDNWMGGEVEERGCDAFLCRPAFWAPKGRATKDDMCESCSDDVQFWGRTTCESAIPRAEKERQILVNMYNVMGGRNWKTGDDWLSLDVDVCQWSGISCTTDGRVSSIILRNNGLTGEIPKDIFSLAELTTLNLESNSIEFDFAGIGSAAKLEVLDLSSTDLPAASLNTIDELSSLENLRFLSVASNSLGGSIPEGLFALTGLDELRISFNAFSGKLSTQIGQMTNLQRFGCTGNMLTGQLPTEIGNLSGLQELSAGENQFGGTLPTQLNLLTNLQTLSLQQFTSSSGIWGPLLSFRDLGQLTSLQLDSNRLTGTVPAYFLVNSRRLDAQIYVGLSDNRIEGSLPSQWSRFDRLFVDLAGNKIEGINARLCKQRDWMGGDVAEFDCDAILCPKGKYNDIGRQSDSSKPCQNCPNGRGNYFGAKSCDDDGGDDYDAGEDSEDSPLKILTELFTSSNGLGWKKKDGWDDTSDYCSFFGITCDVEDRVTKIELPNNGLKGDIPKSIYKLNKLRELILSQNDINFSFEGIDQVERLETLSLDDTNLDDIDGIGDAHGLLRLHLQDNNLDGEIPRVLYLLSNLRELDIGYNHFTGKVPNVIGALTALTSLKMYHNLFTGRLPAALGDLTNLRELNLAENNFEGTIPQELNELTELRFLSIQRDGGVMGTTDIGINQGDSSALGPGLTGPLPALDNLKSISELYLGVNSLTGTVPFNFLDGVSNKDSLIKVDITSNQLTGTLPASLTQFQKMSFYAAGNRFTDIADGLCVKTEWMNGNVATYECDGILCPVNTYNTLGRKGGDSTTCRTCPDGTSGYIGSFECLSSTEQQEKTEQAILEKLYREMNGDSWIDNTNWMDMDESICTWFGIQCISDDNPSVTSIDLGNNRLGHTFTTEIFNLPNLRELDLHGNAIRFSFEGIGNAKNLEYLDLEDLSIHSLTGVEKATEIKVLRVDRNLLNAFPEEIYALSKLEALSMSKNSFPKQGIPVRLQDFSNLIHLSCSNCGFIGNIPTWLGSMSNLEFIRLEQNALEGSMPSELQSLMNLKHLDLSDQSSSGGGISGSLLDFSLQTKLTDLFLQHNKITGTIPASLLKSVNNNELVTIDLRHNELKGAIPADLARISDLNLYLGSNYIEELPGELCSKGWNEGATGDHNCDAILCDKGSFNVLGRATAALDCIPCSQGDFAQYYGATFCGSTNEHESLLNLYSNSGGPDWLSDENWLQTDDHCTWEGITCHEDGEFEGLVKEIRLADNNLVGTVPLETIWQLEGLEYVDMQKNDISVSFKDVANAKNLETVILSETKTDSLEFIGSATSLKSLHITNAALHGEIPSDLYDLTQLEELYLSHNELKGTLSTSIGQMKKLRDLYMFGNQIKDTLPSELGLLASIEHLSLGENKFSGTIPWQITSLPSLKLLSLQKEQAQFDNPLFAIGGGGFTGTLPAFDKLPRISELYLGHNSFTGTIPEHFLQGITDKSEKITIDLSFNSVVGSIPKSLKEFDDLEILLASNQIHSIPDAICDKHDWMNGEVANGCDAILCSPGTFNQYGRRVDSKTLCDPCTYPGSAVDYGSTSCGPVSGTDLLDDRAKLFELYDATGGLDWFNNSNWEDNVPFCDWYGVTCEPVGDFGTMTVTEIVLSENNMNGIIPSILFHLPKLRKLDIRDNPVSMSFNAIHQASNLEELYLDKTRVSSLKGIAQATSLTALHLHKNSFSWGTIPEELFDLTSLIDLNLSDSMFSGALSSKIGNLKNLVSLSLVGNSLSGQIPSEIGMLDNLEVLSLSNNNWSGTLPESISGLVSLKGFFLENESGDTAGISGPLHSFSTMPGLRELHLSWNQLTGSIPDDFLADIDDVDSIIDVFLHANHLVGTLPSQLSTFNKLTIEVSDNLITGIGEGLCEKSEWFDGLVGRFDCDAILCPAGEYSSKGRQTNEVTCEPCPGAEGSPYMGASFCLSAQKQIEKDTLELLYAATNGDEWKKSDNWMDDEFDICDWYGISCQEGSTVESILLGSNHLVGTLPSEVLQLPNLKFLWLYSNPVEFSFEGIAQASSLRSLLLDSTKTRSLRGIGEARSLVDIDIRFNQLTGTLPKEIERLEKLETFTCSENRFTGTVPEWTALRKLNTLRMSNNMFTGTLPSFSGHPEMASLDLSENKLNGTIPKNLLETASPDESVFLDLSENMLTGTIPGELARFTDLTLFLRNNRIEAIDPDLCSLEDWNEGDVGRFECDGILCPSGTYSPSGRASRAGATCKRCGENKFFGGTDCSEANARLNGGMIGSFSIFVLALIGLLL